MIVDKKSLTSRPYSGSPSRTSARWLRGSSRTRGFCKLPKHPRGESYPRGKRELPSMIKCIQAEGSRAQIEKLPQVRFTKPSRNLHGIGVTFLGFDWRGNSPQLPLHHKTSHFASRACSRWLHGPSRMRGFQLLRYPFTDTFTGASRTFTDTCFLKRPG